MRRVAIVTDWFAPRRGGIETQLGELATRLAGAGHDVHVVTGTPGPSTGSPFTVRRLGVRTLASPPLVVSPHLLRALRRELESGWDIVHAHVSIVSPVGWAAAHVARSLGLPTALTFHSVLRGKALALRAVAALARLSSSRIAWSAVSGLVAQRAQWALGGAPVSVLPNGMDLEWWASAAPRGGAGAGRVTLVSAMRLHRKKRGAALVRAFARAVKGSPIPARLVLAGDGPDHGRIARALASGQPLAPHHTVELPGWLDAPALRELYRSADAFVLASVHESFGIAALEAAASGLPVVARGSGLSGFVRPGETGLLADDDDALTDAIRAVVNDAALRQRLRPDPRELSRYDWGEVVAAHLAEYERASRLAASAAPAAAPSA